VERPRRDATDCLHVCDELDPISTHCANNPLRFSVVAYRSSKSMNCEAHRLLVDADAFPDILEELGSRDDSLVVIE
jgi:hypothetical protein